MATFVQSGGGISPARPPSAPAGSTPTAACGCSAGAIAVTPAGGASIANIQAAGEEPGRH